MFQKAKGTTDFYPEELARLKHILGKLVETAQRYGYKEIDAPAFEELKLLCEKEGDETKQEIFVLEKRGDEQFGLRFDMTVPSARMFCAIQKSAQKPIKWCYATRNWRYERPQKGRLREFHQFGIELFGSSRPEADAEAINLAIDGLKALGLTDKDIRVEVNNRKLLQGLVSEYVGENKVDEAIRAIDKRSKVSDEEFLRSLKQIGAKDPSKIVEILDLPDIKSVGKLNLNPQAKEGYTELKAVMDLIDPKYCSLKLALARGLSYYTGTVFEIFDVEKKYRALAGGGRYDKMVEQFGGESTPAVGIAMGPVPIQLVLEETGKLPKIDIGVEYYVAPVDDTCRKTASEVTYALRQRTSAEMDLTGRSLSKQMAYAGGIGAKKIIIIGPKDLAEGKATVRDLESGKEDKTSIKDICGQTKESTKSEGTKNRHPPRH